ncbi:helix-turn-helix transcriptional regulator [Streptomyces sp. NBC_01795]|uniref:helix-turn-helix domain-containing protein n=1 Tax=unclassified Streptomyces TaxID=2593676 RepID=UPI002DDB0CAD|nr:MULTISPECIES: helix-turn-helix transcriptional regulator [unclassified Streptomyces]WSA94113.1 helix-turn-helix transcriptional regulator [Streptomyces sp. NBC_01795]WSB78538.1 helix-turn-helix transcriptional regulator [Streptomyces sp. NBC_01775]WSS13262.1 helix-turn-helix transcriptional regulator [Streptomyces sp. NBC_01186]
MRGLQEEHAGVRIAHQRKLAGLTQRGMAARMPYSYSLLRQVEEGRKNASPDLVSAVARVLRIDVTALTGQPYVTELQQDKLATLIRPIRESLDLYDLVDGDGPAPRTTAELAADVDELCRLVRATQLSKASHALPPLIAEVTAAVHRAPTTALWQTLGSAYRTAHDIATKLGFYDLATIALDRLGWAAERGSDPLLAAVRQYMRALAYFREGEHTIGLRLIDTAHHAAAQADPEARGTLAVRGQLHLGAGVIAARAHDCDGVASHLREAASYAERTGEAGRVHWLSFGPANVAAHEVSAQVEMRRYGKALEKSKDVRLPHGWAMSRRAHFYVDRARAEMETGRSEAALGSLMTARKLAPQQTRYHPGARETINGLVAQRRRTPDSLDNMAAWLGL